MGNLLQIDITVPAANGSTPSYCSEDVLSPDCNREALIAQLTTFLTMNIAHGWEEEENATNGHLVFRVILDKRPSSSALIEEISLRWPNIGLLVQEISDQDWSLAWKEYFTPIKAGSRFEILPPWSADQADPTRTPIFIEPKMAFGTGHHPTTALCLEHLSNLVESGRIKKNMEFLDLGTGSGILGIALSLLGLTGVGLDIDPLAMHCARENVLRNHVAEKFTLAAGSLDSLAVTRGFDVVVANILAGPLISMAPDLLDCVAQDGVLILSGILSHQAEDVARAYSRRGRPRIETKGDDDTWAVLVWS
ncbi:50S ribosomal protein L11 methyltransferase [Desulfovibrio inopinatus]|uniref:50S ribosomal protein L11 methyltransferase n=1 Tax=Desulfovibrio inopinatus TaxID=102109 RepID=UPI001FDF3A04|nr:50S ribosomal protein L11 methyltransferase [Desulfovibrio inopinatus]